MMTLPSPKGNNSTLWDEKDWLYHALASFAPDDPLVITALAVPGLMELIDYPCDCNDALRGTIRAGGLINIIVHLNDGHAWKRENIADWLDTLDVDLSFS